MAERTPESRHHADEPAAPLDEACARLLKLVRSRCPGLLPDDPLRPGETAEPVLTDPKRAATLINLAARQAAVLRADGRPTPEPEELPHAVLWREGADALLVEVGSVATRFATGLVTVLVPVRCDQVPHGRAVVEVEFVVGSARRPTGLLAATSEPRGPAVVIRRWGDALAALAWRAVLDTVGALAAATGRDTDGTALVPAALTADREGLSVQAQARHPVDRVRQGQVAFAPAPGPVRP
ncbi:hypothetical protein BN159_7448 [Streptomyces davaonensis JCM 4913]|uniref:Uncharacterized protein n=1 Tax=Streptomyces davaonensis (strain DSM 101723 / JCM 4913 / KCC S-0913 / 768) TaxID=1214101 RepID=K4RE76_STRDJ|nr:hypothetical protein [Streptomyces davaonensis]CCK31827.1 hypothetical protein BN159_7448 [Streptomyces davaonensis JCM 4913]